MRIPNVDQITLRQLLNHTGGVYDYADDAGRFLGVAFGEPANWPKVWTPQELLAYADGAKYAPYAWPGQLAHYSNTDYILLGLVIQKATGDRLADEIRARILVPLALDETCMASMRRCLEGTSLVTTSWAASWSISALSIHRGPGLGAWCRRPRTWLASVRPCSRASCFL